MAMPALAVGLSTNATGIDWLSFPYRFLERYSGVSQFHCTLSSGCAGVLACWTGGSKLYQHGKGCLSTLQIFNNSLHGSLSAHLRSVVVYAYIRDE